MDDGDRLAPNWEISRKLWYLREQCCDSRGRVRSFEEIAEHVRAVTGRNHDPVYLAKFFTGEARRKPEGPLLAAILDAFGKVPSDLWDRGDPAGTFGQRLQHQRYLRGCASPQQKLPTQDEIAQHVERQTGRSCTGAYIGLLINDKARNGPAIDKIQALADYFEISPARFFDDPHSQELIASERVMQEQKAFIDALAELHQVTGGLGFRLSEPVDPADLPKLTEEIRHEIEAAKKQ